MNYCAIDLVRDCEIEHWHFSGLVFNPFSRSPIIINTWEKPACSPYKHVLLAKLKKRAQHVASRLHM